MMRPEGPGGRAAAVHHHVHAEMAGVLRWVFSADDSSTLACLALGPDGMVWVGASDRLLAVSTQAPTAPASAGAEVGMDTIVAATSAAGAVFIF